MKAGLKSFGNLLSEVVRKGFCTLCGACVASCSAGVLKVEGEAPTIVGKCTLCELCYFQCPKTETDINEIEVKVFGRPRRVDEDIGIYKSCYTARSRDQDVLKVAQDGGVVTSILSNALNKGLIDCAVVTGLSKEEPWKPEPKASLSIKEVMEAAGSKYTISPTLIGLALAVNNYGRMRVAVVGTPCQILASRKMQSQVHGAYKLGGRISLAIGLFCLEAFSYGKLMENYVHKMVKDPFKISKFSIREGRFIIYVDGVEEVNEPLKKVKEYVWKGCSTCIDFTAEFADISVGSVGSQLGWSTVIVRTLRGEEFFEDAVREGLIECKPLNEAKLGIKKIIKLAKLKRGRGYAKG